VIPTTQQQDFAQLIILYMCSLVLMSRFCCMLYLLIFMVWYLNHTLQNWASRNTYC